MGRRENEVYCHIVHSTGAVIDRMAGHMIRSVRQVSDMGLMLE
jgi:hypothetical protein